MKNFTPASSVNLRVVVAEGVKDARHLTRKYRGWLEVARRGRRTLVVNHVYLDDYVRGVLPGEISPAWAPESVRAMAIVARSYAYQRWLATEGAGQHLFSDSRSQEYCGLVCEDPRSNRAVEETAGLVLVKNGRVIPAFSHACCGGHTEDIREVWGGDRDDVFAGRECRWCFGSKHFGPWALIMEKTTLARRLSPEIGKGMSLRSLRVDGFTESRRVRNVVVSAGIRQVRISGARFRALIGYNELRSARFEITDSGETVEFRGTGWGHGVGLCQEGARRMAEEGRDFESILKYYFPGCEVWRLPD